MKQPLRSVILLAFVACLASIALLVFSIRQATVNMLPSSEAIDRIERQFIEKSKLNESQLRELERRIGIIKANETHIWERFVPLWFAAVGGFSFFAVVCLLVLVVAVRANRLYMDSPPTARD